MSTNPIPVPPVEPLPDLTDPAPGDGNQDPDIDPSPTPAPGPDEDPNEQLPHFPD
ncbi:hypothetical protein ACFCV3_02780 [Kribbella sp. NPDC056345]|uniref:hypothetical protein n=1 Tax=Kribbella sp. NPDC056345 TaxID=3345789 RepID=UPI0035D55688